MRLPANVQLDATEIEHCQAWESSGSRHARMRAGILLAANVGHAITVAELAESQHVSRPTVYNVLRDYREGGVAAVFARVKGSPGQGVHVAVGLVGQPCEMCGRPHSYESAGHVHGVSKQAVHQASKGRDTRHGS